MQPTGCVLDVHTCNISMPESRRVRCSLHNSHESLTTLSQAAATAVSAAPAGFAVPSTARASVASAARRASSLRAVAIGALALTNALASDTGTLAIAQRSIVSIAISTV